MNVMTPTGMTAFSLAGSAPLNSAEELEAALRHIGHSASRSVAQRQDLRNVLVRQPIGEADREKSSILRRRQCCTAS